jgi:hypothetical protein
MSGTTVNDTVDLLGVVVLARHGDRDGFYQHPETYDASETELTPLGEVRTRNFPSYSATFHSTLTSNFYNFYDVRLKPLILVHSFGLDMLLGRPWCRSLPCRKTFSITIRLNSRQTRVWKEPLRLIHP